VELDFRFAQVHGEENQQTMKTAIEKATPASKTTTVVAALVSAILLAALATGDPSRGRNPREPDKIPKPRLDTPGVLRRITRVHTRFVPTLAVFLGGKTIKVWRAGHRDQRRVQRNTRKEFEVPPLR
jgi:hypothetical protein